MSSGPGRRSCSCRTPRAWSVSPRPPGGWRRGSSSSDGPSSTFDPPGVFESAGLKPRLTLDEMVEGAETAIKATGTAVPLPVVGHSQGALAALYLGLARPLLVDRLVLVGAVDGGLGAARRAGGMPFGWSLLEADFWRFAWLGIKLSFGRGSLADQERLRRIVVGRSFVDPPARPRRPDRSGRRAPATVPARRLAAATRSVDLQPRLGEIVVPTLVCCGRLDPDAGARERRDRRRRARRPARRVRQVRALPVRRGGGPLLRGRRRVPRRRPAPRPGPADDRDAASRAGRSSSRTFEPSRSSDRRSIGAWPRPRRSPTCAGSPAGTRRGPCSTTPTAPPRARRACGAARRLPADRVRAERPARRLGGRPRRRRSWAARRRCRWSSPRPGSPA